MDGNFKKFRRKWTGPEKWQVGLAGLALLFTIIDHVGLLH